MKQKIDFTNFSGNIGNQLIKEIYKKCYRLEADIVVVTESKYNSYAVCNLYDSEHGGIAENYTISL